MYIIQTVFLIALFAAFINGLLLLLDKWGIRNRISLYAPFEWVARMIGCDFCMAHHFAVLMMIPLLYNFRLIYLVIPLGVAGLIHQLR